MNEVKGGTGLPKNSAAALSVLLGPTILGPLVFIVLEKDKFVRFYAMQSLLTFLLLIVVSRVFSLVVILSKFNGLLWIAGFSMWLFLTMKAWNGEEFEIPLFGKLAHKFLDGKATSTQ